jgi:spermidine/putrescine-binding protein
MKRIVISDSTMKQFSKDIQLSFKEKIELAKLLDKIGVDFIELNGIKNARIDSLLIKSIVSAVNDSKIAVPVELNDSENIEKTWTALKDAKNPELAHKLINFILRPDIYAQICDYLTLPSMNIESRELMEKTPVYSIDDVLSCEIKDDVGEAIELYNEVWQDIRIGG